MTKAPALISHRSIDAEGVVVVDMTRLIATRLLVEASSGAGKSWLLRRLLEVTYGHAQHIVLDWEGEFHTLREQYDYVLVGPGGDCPADVRSAGLLATRVLEMGVSVVIDLSDLGAKRPLYVKNFIESLMIAPRELWHDVLVFVDECHKLAPEKGAGEAESTEAIKDLATRGRKRGFALVAATQRVSELHKTVIAEMGNKLIGRTSLDLDINRAAAMLGMSRKDSYDFLPKLEDGYFYAFGPALCKQVTLIKVGKVQTTHPTAGQRSLPPTPPRARIKQVLSQLADLPKEAAEEVKTSEGLRARVRELEMRLQTLSTDGDAVINRQANDALERRIADLNAHTDQLVDRQNEVISQLRIDLDEEKHWGKVTEDILETASRELEIIADRAHQARNAIVDQLQDAAERPTPRSLDKQGPKVTARTASAAAYTAKSATIDQLIEQSSIGQALADIKERGIDAHAADLAREMNGSRRARPSGDMRRTFLIALAMYPHGMTRRQLFLRTNYSTGGTTNQCIAQILKDGVVVNDGPNLLITDSGQRELGVWQPLLVRRALREDIISKLPGIDAAFCRIVFDAYPNDVPRTKIFAESGYSSGGTTNNAIARLIRKNLFAMTGKGSVIAARELFE